MTYLFRLLVQTVEGMPFTQCPCSCSAKALYVGNYLNPSFWPFHKFGFHNRFFHASCASGMWHI